MPSADQVDDRASRRSCARCEPRARACGRGPRGARGSRTRKGSRMFPCPDIPDSSQGLCGGRNGFCDSPRMDMRNRRPYPVVLRLRSSYAFCAMKLDQQKREAVLRALSALPHDHPARIAFDRGADPIALMHLLEGDETVENLKEIWLTAYHRLLQRQGRHLQRWPRHYSVA